MQERSVIERVWILERKVEVLETVPARVTAVELQLLQLRDEMRGEFSAIRGDAGADVTLSGLRDEIREMRGGAGPDVTLSGLRDEIRAGDDDTRRYMRVLHEEVISRLAIIQEGQRPRRKR